jgi:CheY-like chemotaxis protein
MIVEPSPPTATFSIPVPLGNILLAEDDPELLDLLASYLRRRGYRVFCAPDGEALVRRIDRSAPRGPLPPIDVIVSDIYMPGIDGLAVLEELREGGRRIPTILMTAFGSEELRERGRMNGAHVMLAYSSSVPGYVSTFPAAHVPDPRRQLAHEAAVVADEQQRPVVACAATRPGLARVEVEVVGRLVHQHHVARVYEEPARATRARSPPDSTRTGLSTSSPLNRNAPSTLRTRVCPARGSWPPPPPRTGAVAACSVSAWCCA